MKLSPTSDESWQYIFNIIENKKLRQTSIIIDNSNNIVENIQKFKLFKVNQNKYSLIISLTSHKHWLKKLNLKLESIFNNTMKPSKIVLSLYKDDFFFNKTIKRNDK